MIVNCPQCGILYRHPPVPVGAPHLDAEQRRVSVPTDGGTAFLLRAGLGDVTWCAQ